MSWTFLIAIIIAIAAISLVQFSKNRAPESKEYPYQKKSTLLTAAERSFYGVLKKAIGEHVEIFSKVRVADAIEPIRGLSASDRQKSFNRLSAKHFDFILCRKDDLSIICTVELDDRSHQSDKRQQRDEFLNRACDAAGVPVIHVPAKKGYVIDEIKQLISPYLDIPEAPPQEQASSPQKAISEKTCPNCSSPMVIRIARKGDNAGKKFWACSSYPNCRHIEAIPTQ